MRESIQADTDNDSSMGAAFPQDLLSEEPTDEVNVTIKNYSLSNGLSQRFHNKATHNDFFFIKGPMGKGLGLSESSEGLHIAFAAGTGILVFVDLVARIAVGDLDLIPES